MSYTSGRPLSVTTNNTLAYFNPGRRPNLVSPNIRTNVEMSSFDPATDLYLNRSAFADPAAGQFGNARAISKFAVRRGEMNRSPSLRTPASANGSETSSGWRSPTL